MLGNGLPDVDSGRVPESSVPPVDVDRTPARPVRIGRVSRPPELVRGLSVLRVVSDGGDTAVAEIEVVGPSDGPDPLAGYVARGSRNSRRLPNGSAA
ncbi:hypothetical protein SAMN05660464_1165 [Geodermatophilus dictyosporus]|uniref:Uncharacterized protein n=1 Tax=Geodermatophilus dictyosporus TaxID=1523247 RepID=A0A1I5K041_9ACTN|nr:hypothetical protein SAMN05660464_1165 [Geodermatophilus dictyosporus]